jgi:hypothetical protein
MEEDCKTTQKKKRLFSDIPEDIKKRLNGWKEIGKQRPCDGR